MKKLKRQLTEKSKDEFYTSHSGLALGIGYMTGQSYMQLWMGITLILCVFFLAGVVVTVVDLLTMKPARTQQ